MKTPRDLLLGRQAGMEPKLDAITRKVVAQIGPNDPKPISMSWKDLLYSLRWHGMALGSSWMVIFFLNVESPAENRGHFAAAATPSAHQLLAALHEQRRQLSQWGSEQTPLAIAPTPIRLPPRSELNTTNHFNLA
ncbi:MAG TPA: hypothetical protein VMZ27_12690 [Candidatus Saccharimonadales bacterium]|nr:hypothetical protein [Candidatus Saccharimonadales bacterium]